MIKRTHYIRNRSVLGSIIILLLSIAVIGGYIANIVKLTGLWSAPITLEVIIRILGAFPFIPLGVILGYL